MKRKHFQKKQHGFTLTELLIAAIAIGLGLVGLVYLYNRYDATDQVNTMVRMAVDRASTVRSATGGAPNYGTASLNLAVHRNGAFDPNFYRVSVAGSVATVTNKWNGTTTITGNTNNFTWAEANVPGKVCAGWVTKLTADTWSTVTIAAGTNTALTVPVSAATAATECAGAGTITLASAG
jgi:prepilin-type N-terminal cleavage/methylation domain-containing protein